MNTVMSPVGAGVAFGTPALSNAMIYLTMAKYRQVVATAADAAVNVGNQNGALVGYSFAETTGTDSAKFYLRDGNDVTGYILAVVTLGANESVRDFFAGGINFGTGLFLDVVEGSVEGSVWFE